MFGKLCIATLLCTGVAAAQSNPNSPTFETVSIRQNVNGGNVASFGPTADGFRMVNMPLGRVILTAYVPQNGEALYWEPAGFPDWLSNLRYDITAKISTSDLAKWQDPALHPEMLRAMLQAMLAERCKLVIHREQKDAKVYYLAIAKGGPKFGPKFKEVSAPMPDEKEQPSPFPSGGLAVPDGNEMHFSHAPIKLLASFLTNRNLGGPEIQDRTGLTGRYDIVIDWGSWTGGVNTTAEATDPGPSIFSAVAALGLKLEPAKGKSETLIVDHVERPSAN